MIKQNRTISGKLTDRDTKEGMMMATVQMLRADSTFVKGTLTNGSGEFSITAPDNGKYLLRFTSVGYTSIVKPVVISEEASWSAGR